MASSVYFTDARVEGRDSVAGKLKRLLKAAGLDKEDLSGKFVAIKAHFGENGNSSYLKPLYARAIAEMVKEAGGIPFVTDCSTLYPGMRGNGMGHLLCAELNGFNSISAGCPVFIGDGIRGNDEVALPVPQVEGIETWLKEAYFGRALVDADLVIALTHVKGCMSTAYAGAIKNIAMGCASRRGKKDMHCDANPAVNPERCVGCGRCVAECGQEAIEIRDGKAFINEKCAGCVHCIAICPKQAISTAMDYNWNNLQHKLGEYAAAFVAQKKVLNVGIAVDISPQCDCFSQSDAPVVGDIGMFASWDIVALDQAAADAIDAQPVIPGTVLGEYRDTHGHDVSNTHALAANSDWEIALDVAEKLGAGSRNYQLHQVK